MKIAPVLLVLLLGLVSLVSMYLVIHRILWVNTGAPITSYDGRAFQIAGVSCDDWVETKPLAHDPTRVHWRCGMFMPLFNQGDLPVSSLPDLTQPIPSTG